ncbi:unnamed protein product, partial [Meganyctiphanes norvegica]
MATEQPIVGNLNGTLSNLRTLRSGVTRLFKVLADGPEDDVKEDGENGFVDGLSKVLGDIKSQLRDLEVSVSSLTSSPGNSGNLGNTGVLSLDPSSDKLQLYYQLLDCYTWTDKVHSYAGMVHPYLHNNSLKRSQWNASYSLRRKRHNAHNAPPTQVDIMLQTINQLFPDMTLIVSRPFGQNAVVQVTLGRVLRAVVTFRGLLIEWVVVRAYNEPWLDDDGKFSLRNITQRGSFRRKMPPKGIGMLFQCSPSNTNTSILINSLQTWLHSFQTLFTDICKKCGNYLHNHMPPTWREFRTLDPYHEECKP